MPCHTLNLIRKVLNVFILVLGVVFVPWSENQNWAPLMSPALGDHNLPSTGLSCNILETDFMDFAFLTPALSAPSGVCLNKKLVHD